MQLHQETEKLQVNDMNNSKKRNGIVTVLMVLVLVVWGLGLAGWVKGSSGGLSLFKKGDSYIPETQKIEETTQIEPPVQTPPPKELDETAPMETSVETPAPLELDASGVWDMTFRRYYSIDNEGSWESIGMEEIFLWMEIYPGNQFECDIMPYEGTINGESYADSLAIEPQLHTGEVVGNMLRLYLDLDDFYLDLALEVSDTIQPNYIEIPITAENGQLSGTYDFTWVAVVDDYNLQSRVTIELEKR
ncbi:hypothetical protein SDC9_127932 [bioreactor metagenome]|uniref:Uncharacterized protein n=1 Tax=bioreactor metagenome TaxID=1076179 RepID=A0A645CVE9_9ZZZZ